MQKINFKDDILPHLIAIFVFFLVVFIYFNSVFLENKSIRQQDILQWKGGAKSLIDHREKTGEEGLWADNMFSGMPGYLVNVQFSGDIGKTIKSIVTLGLPRPADQVFVAFVSFYILLLVFGVRPYLAIVGALGFGLTSFTLVSIEAGHNSKVMAYAFMPAVLAGIHHTFRNHKLTGLALFSLALALHLRETHLQITYYLLLVTLIYGFVMLFFAYKENRLKNFFTNTSILVIGALIAVGTVLGKLWITLEYSDYSIRGKSPLSEQLSQEGQGGGLDKSYAFRWSNGVMETMTLMIPHFYGGASSEGVGRESNLANTMGNMNVPNNQVRQITQNAPTYWGNQPFTAGPVYAGAIICFLFILGLITVEKKHKYWLISIVVLSFILSWGKNFAAINYFLFDYLPLYNKFRTPSMALSIALVGMPLLGMLGLERLVQIQNKKERDKKLLIAGGIAGGICLFFALIAGAFSFRAEIDSQLQQSGWPEQLVGALRQDRQAMLRSDAFRSFFFIAGGFALVYLLIKNKINYGLTATLLGLLVVLDLAFVDKRYLNSESFERDPQRNFFQPTPADQYIMQDNALSYRVLNLNNPFNEARTSYFHQSIGGYHGAKMGRYQDLIEHGLQQEIQMVSQQLQQGNPNFNQFGILNMLNTKYIMAGNQRESVVQNPTALGNAWFVENIRPAGNADEVIQAVQEINTANTAVMDTSEFTVSQTSYNGNGTAQLVHFDPNHLEYEVNTSEKGILVFSEIYYPKGWEATIDGEPANILRTNYVLRAMEVPSGEHTITFKFEPTSYYVGNQIMWASNIILILVFFGSMGIRMKQLFQ